MGVIAEGAIFIFLLSLDDHIEVVFDHLGPSVSSTVGLLSWKAETLYRIIGCI